MWCNEVKNHLRSTQDPKSVKKQQINQILTELAPTELDACSHSPEFDIATIQAIAAVKCGDVTTAAASDEENRRDSWKKGEHKQLNRFCRQGVFRNPFDSTTLALDAIVLGPTWQHVVKRRNPDFASTGAREQPLFLLQLCLLGHLVWKWQSKGHFLHHVLLKAAKCMALMSKMHVHTPRHLVSKHTQELLMHALNVPKKSWENKPRKDL